MWNIVTGSKKTAIAFLATVVAGLVGFAFIMLLLEAYVGFDGALVIVAFLLPLASYLLLVNWKGDPAFDPKARVAVTAPFEKIGSSLEGRVVLDGETWRAVLVENDGTAPQVGELVQIIGRTDLILKVRRSDDAD